MDAVYPLGEEISGPERWTSALRTSQRNISPPNKQMSADRNFSKPLTTAGCGSGLFRQRLPVRRRGNAPAVGLENLPKDFRERRNSTPLDFSTVRIFAVKRGWQPGEFPGGRAACVTQVAQKEESK